MSNPEKPPQGSDEPKQDGNIDLQASSETMTALNNTVNTFLEALPPKQVEEQGDGWSYRQYDTDLTDGDAFVRITASVVCHDEFGLVQRPMVEIIRGVAQDGPDMSSDFSFSIRDAAIWNDEPLTLDDDGNVIAGSDERFSFIDKVAIDARKKELLADPSFDGPSQAVTLPNMQTTPSGEIYQDGVEAVTHSNPLPGIAISSTFRCANDEVAANYQRQMAVVEQAYRDVSTELTEERAERIIAMLARLYAELPGK
jgi:hypothetical protein